jgi:site-specific recombinase XerC
MIGVEKPETTRSLVAETVKTIARRKKRQKPKQAAPARLGQDFDRDTPLSFTLEVLLAACGEDLVGLRDRTMMSMAYDAGLRRSELAAVNTDDIEVYPEGDGSLAIGDAKGRDADDIEYVWISEITVEYMRIWRAAARVEDGALFRPIFVSRKKVAGKFERVLTVGKDAISANSFNEIIKRRARQAWQMGLVWKMCARAGRNGHAGLFRSPGGRSLEPCLLFRVDRI